jgi:Flp pilus assembly protein TadB
MLALTAVLAWPGGRWRPAPRRAGRRASLRARAEREGVTPPRAEAARAEAGRARPVAVALVAGAAVALLLGGVVGAVAGGLISVATALVLTRLEPRSERDRRERLRAQAPLVVDLVAACLASGAALDPSLSAAAQAVGPPVSHELGIVVASLRLGADPEMAWAATDPALAGLARAVARSSQTGAPLADLLPRVAAEARAVHRAQAEARVRTASVRLTAPLGAAFLPAFVLLGVVPLVASWMAQLL